MGYAVAGLSPAMERASQGPALELAGTEVGTHPALDSRSASGSSLRRAWKNYPGLIFLGTLVAVVALLIVLGRRQEGPSAPAPPIGETVLKDHPPPTPVTAATPSEAVTVQAKEPIPVPEPGAGAVQPDAPEDVVMAPPPVLPVTPSPEAMRIPPAPLPAKTQKPSATKPPSKKTVASGQALSRTKKPSKEVKRTGKTTGGDKEFWDGFGQTTEFSETKVIGDIV